ncbi:amino acid/amide ABC transporter membrane protein 1 (HAAT family) [Actinocorallia herbida]|uniref:Amino acid/amide ABC transporter membrane protein 1 (HAAT family) n=1 Tax=Actinocorallia herbida TaxID=58109 RepID=A0A3N1DA91_9ACTN|nr:branched-chain amino acid ABC transporter permease [Actinocorallia herbida]ROO90406.1 amino acid/amide ABC transporter membrane protein 1 (HAAT family) [Actinocorallia herbida]
MTRLIELLINGLSLGSVYALIALGFVVIFRATEVVNFAHASLLLLGGYVTAVLHEDLGFVGALVVGVLAAAAAGALIELVLLRRAKARRDVVAIATIGIDIVLMAELSRRLGTSVMSLGDPWQDRVVVLGGVTIAQTRIAALVVAAVLIGLFLLAFKYTPWGVSMRAVAEDAETSALMGIRLGRISMSAWAVAGALAAVAAVFITAFPTPGLDRTSSLAALKAFPAAILGGLDSVTGALVGGLLIGVTEALVGGYQNDLTFLGRGLGDVAPYVVMIAILLVRPSGLFGTREVSRV